MAIFTAFMAFTGLSSLAGALTIFGLSPGISAAIIGVGKSLLWNVAAAALGPKPKVTPQEVQALLSQSAGPRIRAYGQYLLGGTRALWEAKDGNLYQIIVAHHGPVSEVVGWYIDGLPVVIDGVGNIPGGYLNIKYIESGDGGDYGYVRDAFPTIWTTDHKLTGLASYAVLMSAPPLEKMSKIFPRQAQTSVQMVAKCAEVMDPRTMLTGYSDLTGPCALDYLTHPDGYRIPLSAIDLDSFAQFTDLCDQDVDLKGGGTEKRYRIGGYYTLEDAPKDVMARLLATADAQMYMTAEGKVGVLGGEWLDPDVTITSADILEFSLSDGSDVFTDFNVLKGIFMSPDHRYQDAEVEEMRDDVALLTEPERVGTLNVDMCPSFAQMRRLMKPEWERNHREWVGTIKTNLVGMKARIPRGRGKHVIRLVIDELEIDQAFEVLGHSYSVQDRECQISVASIENPYTWDAEAEEGTPPPPLSDLIIAGGYVGPPTGLVVSQGLVTLAGGQRVVRLLASVDDPGREDLQLRLERLPIGSLGWLPMIVGAGQYTGYSDVESEGVTVSVRASWVGYDGYSSPVSTTPIAYPTPPDGVTGMAASAAGGTITLDWINATTGYYQTRIYRGTSAIFAGASLIATLPGVAGSAQSYDDIPASGTWYYWAITLNPSLIEAAPDTAVSETV